MELSVLLAAFIIGIIVGRKKQFKHDWLLLSTVVLLFVMGYEIGNNDSLFRKLPSIGWISLVISLASVAGSVLAAYILNCFLKGKKRCG